MAFFNKICFCRPQTKKPNEESPAKEKTEAFIRVKNYWSLASLITGVSLISLVQFLADLFNPKTAPIIRYLGFILILIFVYFFFRDVRDLMEYKRKYYGQKKTIQELYEYITILTNSPLEPHDVYCRTQGDRLILVFKVSQNLPNKQVILVSDIALNTPIGYFVILHEEHYCYAVEVAIIDEEWKNSVILDNGVPGKLIKYIPIYSITREEMDYEQFKI